MHEKLIIIIGSLFILTVLVRVSGFLLGPNIMHWHFMSKIKKYLPMMIMLVLTIYELNASQSIRHYPYGLPALVSVLLLIFLHKLKRNMFLSILSAMICYILLNHYMS